MRGRRSAWAAVACSALLLTASPRGALADSHRVAAIDPDAELARALDVALAPWGATVLKVQNDTPGAAMPVAVERARAIARESGASVVVWVSSTDDGEALWIYDVESDHASARPLDAAPPFAAAVAAEVALAVKTLLRGTVVAPPPERFGAAVREPGWILGTSVGVQSHFGGETSPEPRVGLEASVWPFAFAHRWGALVEIEGGPGAGAQSPAFSGALSDVALRVAVGTRTGLGERVTLEGSVGPKLGFVKLDGVVLSDGIHASSSHLDVGLDPRMGVSLKLLGGRLLVGPWLGMTWLWSWQRFLVHGVPVAQSGPLSWEGALLVALVVP